MSAPPKFVGSTQLAIFLQTNEPVPARPLITLLSEIERLARLQRNLGPTASMEILTIETGTKFVLLNFDRKVALASLAIAVLAFGNDVASGFQKPTGRLAEAAGALCVDHGVSECVITTSEGQLRIARDDMPAIQNIEQARLDGAGRVRRKADYQSPRDEDLLFEDVLGLPAEGSFLKALPEAIPSPRVYTMVGELSVPGRPKGDEWMFISQSGRAFVAKGVDPMRRPSKNPVVIRAQYLGYEDGRSVILVKDVFEPQEPK